MSTPLGERVWVWVGHMGLGDRIRLVLEHYGDRITDVSIFGWSVMRTGELVETFDPTQLDEYRQRWPHLRFWLCFRNMDGPDAEEVGPRAIFDALRDSAAARNRLADEVQRIFADHPWLHGVDIDLESGGDGRSEESEAIFQAVADRAHATGRECGAALPPLTATGSVGGENWVRYKQLGEILDVVEIMSYDFAWAGSAPGPISPGFWMEDVYSWVASQVDPSKIYMGLPLYVYYWRLHDYPPNLGNEWRGISGTYYSFWQQFNGVVPWYADGRQPEVAWVTYRDRESRSLWGFLGAYDWLEPTMYDDATGVDTDRYTGKNYAVRFGEPAGSPIWEVADNSAGETGADYRIKLQSVIDVHGNETGPSNGFTLTLEMLPREAVAATIVDDYVNSDTIWTDTEGWEETEVWDGYRQWRGSGALEYDHDLEAVHSGIYAQARGQFAQDGTFSVYAYGWEAEYRNTDGRIRLLRDGETVETAHVSARAATTEDRASQFVLGLRVRESSARAYFSTSEEGRIPSVVERTGTSAPGGRVGYLASSRVFIDHTYLGHGWWYQPREAVEASIGGEAELLGRVLRNDVEWDSSNRFRPTEDVEEWETHDPDQWSEYSALDWGYEHWQGIPVSLNSEATLRVVPVDHDVWWGRVIAFDREGGFIGYCNDAAAVAHWRGRARHDWGLAGIALWSLGQEDVRLWEVLAAGELPAHTKITNP